jgi:hypothetical protein
MLGKQMRLPAAATNASALWVQTYSFIAAIICSSVLPSFSIAAYFSPIIFVNAPFCSPDKLNEAPLPMLSAKDMNELEGAYSRGWTSKESLSFARGRVND